MAVIFFKIIVLVGKPIGNRQLAIGKDSGYSNFSTNRKFPICLLLIVNCLLSIVYCPLAIEDVAGAQKVASPVNFCKDISVNNTFYATSQVLYNHYGIKNV